MDTSLEGDVLDTLLDEDALESSDDEVAEGDDDTRHKNLLKSLGVEERKETDASRRGQRSEATEDISIYSLGGGKGKKAKISANDLLRGVKESVNLNLLKKNLSRVENTQKHLKAPLPRITAEKNERDAAYHSTSKKVSRWDEIVQRNRKAEHLSFPLKQENLHLNTVDQYVKKFKPRTPLEEQIYELLKGSKYEERPDKELSVAEEEALRSVGLQEARQRRAELQKHRALLSYYEAKNRRLGKIKSRRHLKIIRKQKEKKSAAEFERLQKEDPDGAALKLKRAEKLRAEERAALRHRQGSKWAKNRMLMAKYDEMTKVQIQEQKKLHSNLTKRNVTAVESSDDESADEAERASEEYISLVPPTASQQTLYLPKDNPWLRLDAPKKEAKGQEMDGEDVGGDDQKTDAEKSAESLKNSSALLGLEAVGKDAGAESDLESPDEEVDELQDELVEIRKRKELRKVIQDGDDGTQNGGGDAVQAENIMSFKAAFATLKNESKKRKQPAKKEENDGEASPMEEQNDESSDVELDMDPSRQRTLEDLEKVLQAEEEVVTLSEFHKSSKKKAEKKKETPTLEYIDPKKVFTLPTKDVSSVEPTMVENEDDAASGGEDANLMDIKEAFADDDVIAEFVAEKQQKIAESKPKVQDLTLPGWGEWGGIGLKPSRRRRRKFLVKPKPPPPRKDQHLGHVIINEQRNVHIAKHQVNQIPFPYKDVEQFEKSIQQPIGTTWNTPSIFNELTKPKVTTVAGAIIQPMDEEDAFDKTKSRERKRVVHFDGNITFDDDSGVKRRRVRKRGNKKHKK